MKVDSTKQELPTHPFHHHERPSMERHLKARLLIAIAGRHAVHVEDWLRYCMHRARKSAQARGQYPRFKRFEV
eukprot:357613-Chlamydomonas_euryale.AAC.10